MCGIAGIFDRKARRDIDRDRLKAMAAALAHRGPDGEAIHVEPGLGLVHRRLAIIDLATGDQPIFDEDGSFATVFNGMIYNYRELTRELEAAGHRFSTRCDTEVLVHGADEWGEGLLDRLRGMFALAIWNGREESLFLARDRIGKKPLYWAESEDGFLVFASELNAVLAGLGGARPELRPDAVEDYFALGYVPDPKTIYRGVHKLAPAHAMTVRRGVNEPPRPTRWWRVDFSPDETARRDEELIEALVPRLREAVALRMIADVPLGAFLSGGVDSSAMVAMMAGLSERPVQTCSMGFPDAETDETAYAQMVADRYRTDHFVEVVEPDAGALVGRLAEAYSEPFADNSALPTYLVSKLARRRVTVAVSGDGGDEIFAGYARYPAHMREERLKALAPEGLRAPVFGALAAAWPRMDRAPKPLRAKATLEALSADASGGLFRAVAFIPDAERRALLSGDLKAELGGYHASEVLRAHAREAGTDDPLARAQYVDFHTWLPGQMLVKVDRASMAAGLEVRNPLLDQEFVSWAARLPAAAKLGRDGGKRIFKKALEPHLPREVLYRPKKGFAMPIDGWMREGFANLLDDALGSTRLRDSGLVDMTTASRLALEHRSGRRNHARALWSLVMFESFLSQSRFS